VRPVRTSAFVSCPLSTLVCVMRHEHGRLRYFRDLVKEIRNILVLARTRWYHDSASACFFDTLGPLSLYRGNRATGTTIFTTVIF
jgi:hypothetical protein